MNEVQLTILGFRIWKFSFGVGVWFNEGNPASVAMDVRKPLKWRKWLLGFYHTHPNMLNYPSNTDIRTFYTWGNTLGKHIYCLIEGIDAENRSNPYYAEDIVAISNYKFETYPMENKPDTHDYVGHAYKLGRFFFWKEI